MNNILLVKEDKEFGLIIFRRNLRSRRMSIKISPLQIAVDIPEGCNVQDGKDFIEKVASELKEKQKLARKKTIVLTEDIPLQTLTFEVRIRKSTQEKVFSSLESGVLTIEYPDVLIEDDVRTQHYLWKSVGYFMRHEAKRILPARTSMLADKYNFNYSGVKIQSSVTRWGSCSTQKSINLSFYLLLLPQHLIDYVILHELCHTIEMNHSVRFWKLMDKVTGNRSDALREELKEYSIPRTG